VKRFILPLLLLMAIPALLFAKEYRTVTYETANAGKVVFDHEVHFAKLSRNCTECHNKLYNVAKKNPTVTMAEMEKGKSCGACHNKTRAFALAECTRCHVIGDVPILIPDFGTLTFSHKFHLGMYGCADCHNSIFKAGPGNPNFTMKQMEKGQSCGACHDGKSAFNVTGSCTKCHAVKDIDFSADATFSHKFHVELYACGDCHSRLFVAGPNAKRQTMSDMEVGRSCGGCHNGSMAFSVKGDCAKCHTKPPKEVLFKPTNAKFSHAFHLNIYRCADCHSGIFIGGVNSKRNTMAEMEKSRSCGACHDGNIAFSVGGSCGSCHKEPKDVTFPVKDLGKVVFSHGMHTGLFKCDDCHNKVFRTGVQKKRFTMADMGKGNSCGACHDGKTAFTVAANCGKCHPVKDITFVDDAKFGHTKHLEMYSCNDCHSKLFTAGPDNKRWKMADMEQGKSCGACHDGGTAFSVKGDCDKCHKTTVEISFQVPAAGATPFSHKLHGGFFKCGDCHNGIFLTGSRAKRFTMADMEKGKSCGGCHDGKTTFTVKDNCVRCHPVRDIPFKGTGAVFSHTPHIAMYRCNDCHTSLFIPGAGNKPASMPDMEAGKSCGACHEGKTAFTVAASCEKCHRSTLAVKYEFKAGTEPVVFSHKVHTGKGYQCLDCHGKTIQAGVNRRSYSMKEMTEGKSCGACHGRSMAFSVSDSQACSRCHGNETGTPAVPGATVPE